MSLKTEIIKKQHQWVIEADLKPDEKGYLPSYQSNLFKPLNDRSRQAFKEGSGSELLDSPRYPAKMKAPHSSSALAVNVFDYWVSKDTQLLALALGLEPRKYDVRFEEKFPTGLPGKPPNLDVVLEDPNSPLIGIESKFTEWMTRKSDSKAPFKEKYFQSEVGAWNQVGLPESQNLAELIQSRILTFRYLDVPQLLKHALGMANNLESSFRLYYIYYEGPGDEASAHKTEIITFTERVGSELGFRSISYQNLIAKLKEIHREPNEYLSYLHSRYL